MTNNSKEEEEKTVQNSPIENHDNSRNTEAMEGKLEQSQSILGEQRGDKPTAIMKKQQQMTQYLNEKLAGNINSEDSSKSTPKKKKGVQNCWKNLQSLLLVSFITKKDGKEGKREKKNGSINMIL